MECNALLTLSEIPDLKSDARGHLHLPAPARAAMGHQVTSPRSRHQKEGAHQ